mmetsp:Transcript_15103/g.35374  ORF Transcript_15103/g.35374 Transcript_15103/m.35374 type:complete len:314 (+) Transcript_15103:64-1005(+)|eukprot:CAMPEP_0171090036 /NCGR_PEP_ID=MMETSP0766_2-20121228/28415_1 /TAXON_ID=439317 /ORGANISM="Gambierdiscus australes, Strain CAWD 149" /LENGTH=313 /DNA_ID=CAMNT_0011547979 /DNA_START=63 /DNA_END=1004 /DNA_ORIENTATION=+
MANRSVGRTASSVGMMEGAFFVSRSDLLQWVNGLLQVSLTKVEQCASGAIYCQILDACHPGTVAMRKVNWMAKSDHEFIPNYKVLQVAFDKNRIERHIDVDKLIRAKYQDNLEFLQWMKCYWEREGACRRDYEPLQSRDGKPVPPWARAVGGAMSSAGKENLRPGPASRGEDASAIKKPGHVSRARSGIVSRTLVSPAAESSTSRPTETAGGPEGSGKHGQGMEELTAKFVAQQDELRELRSTLGGLESERDYYFRKLRDVEILCATNEAKMDSGLTAERVLKDIQAILYAGNEDVVDDSAGCGAHVAQGDDA